MLNKFKKFFYSKILRRKYYRTGQCLGCGRCCKKIYVKHFNNNLPSFIIYHCYLNKIKSFISTVQSIGRVLRVSQKKKKALLIDVVDDMSYKKRKNYQQNFALKHFADRFTIYNISQFDYKIKTLKLEI